MRQSGFAPIVVILMVFFFVVAGIYIYKPDMIVSTIANFISRVNYSEVRETSDKVSPTAKPKEKNIASPTSTPLPTQLQVSMPTSTPPPAPTSENQADSEPTPTETSSKKGKPKNEPTVPLVGG